MAGVIQFDRTEVLDRAMMTFWRSGYSGTSIQHLEEATGLGRGSLYNSFGDKQTLFVASLDRYWMTIGQDRLSALSDPNPLVGLRMFFDKVVKQMGDRAHPRGCLFTNTSLECPGAPDVVLRAVAERMRRMEDCLYSTLQRALALGLLDPAADPRALAWFYLSVVKGIGVLHKVHGDTSMLREVTKVAMMAWPQPPRRTQHKDARKRRGV